MLKKRIIPTLLYDGFQCVKPVSFGRPYRKLGAMDQYIEVYEERNIDELLFIDIEATPKGRGPDYVKIEKFAARLMCPLTVGGGISSIDHIRSLFLSGADKVCINTHKELIPNAAQKFGRQAIVACLEYDTDSDYDHVIKQALLLEKHGAGEILLINQYLDGLMEGYDNATLRLVTREVKIPVIQAGGCSDPADMKFAFLNGADAVAAGSMFLYTEYTPRASAEYLHEQGIEVRIDG